jgi:hypothetical protein
VDYIKGLKFYFSFIGNVIINNFVAIGYSDTEN